MIVDSMTLEEVAAQYKGDLDDLLAKRKYFQPKFSSFVKRSTRFPVRAQYEYISHTNHNKYFFCYSAQKRGEWNYPHCIAVGVFDRPEGKYAVVSTFAGGSFIIFPPHFFARYRERILKDETIYGEALIKRFFSVNSMFLKEELTAAHSRAYKKYESEDGAIQAGRCTEGNVFLEILSANVVIMKTIISDEMLYENQKDAFQKMNDSLSEIDGIRLPVFPR